MIALFDRAETRDFTDVHALAARYGTVRLLELAAEWAARLRSQT